MLPHTRNIAQGNRTSRFDAQSREDFDPDLGVSRRIHIVGSGSVGKLVAHSLGALINPPPVTLLFHKPSLADAWVEAGECIKITTAGITETISGFEAELAMPNRRERGREIDHREDPMRTFEAGMPGAHLVTPDGTTAPRGAGSESLEPITSLIVATKAPSTVSAISAVKHRLSASSTICLLQNGMGVIEELNEHLFPDESTRPNFVQGIISHGIYSTSSFAATHAGAGTIQLGIIPRGTPTSEPTGAHPHHPHDDAAPETPPSAQQRSAWAPSSRYLLRTLTRAPALCAVTISPTALLCAQFEKLAINCIINPLTALLDVRNGALLNNFHLTRASRLLLAEISLVVRSLPELRGVPNLQTRFAPARLETLLFMVADKTRDNISSMLADARRGLHTEVDYLNGYVARRGDELGIRCVMNYLVACLVRGKQNVIDREIDEDITLLGKDDKVGYSIGEGGGKRK